MKEPLKKYSVQWAEEKRKTCKLCLRKVGFGFCRRHAPRMIITRTVRKMYTEEELQQAVLEGERRGREEVVKYVNTHLMWGRDPETNDLKISPKHIAEVLELAKLTNRQL